MNQEEAKSLWAAAAGLLDPELRRKAQRWAEAVPTDSPLRTTIAERILGAFKGWTETKAERWGTAAGLAVEKATDFLDFWAGALKSEVALDPDEMKRIILAGAPERIKKATDPEAETERIRLEIDLINEVAELIPPPSKTGDKSLVDLLNALNTKLEKKVNNMEAWSKS